eukprot:scaffold98417_cov61-Attheya_sp.AAC.2
MPMFSITMRNRGVPDSDNCATHEWSPGPCGSQYSSRSIHHHCRDTQGYITRSGESQSGSGGQECQSKYKPGSLNVDTVNLLTVLPKVPARGYMNMLPPTHLILTIFMYGPQDAFLVNMGTPKCYAACVSEMSGFISGAPIRVEEYITDTHSDMQRIGTARHHQHTTTFQSDIDTTMA